MEPTSGSAESGAVMPGVGRRYGDDGAPSLSFVLRSFPATLIVLALGSVPIVSQAADMPAPTPIGAKFETLGVQTGQTAEQVRSTMLKMDPNGTLSEAKGQDPATGQSYVSRLVFAYRQQNPDTPSRTDAVDTVDVLFSGPASGNRSISVLRTVAYIVPEAQPLRDATISAFEQKYGRPPNYDSATGRSTPDPRNVRGTFIFGRDGKIRTPDPKENLVACGLGDQADLRSFTSACSSAEFAYSIINQNGRVQLYKIMIKDTDLALASHKLDEDADKAAAQKKHDADMERLKQSGGAAPRL